jgi:hypothetical protein
MSVWYGSGKQDDVDVLRQHDDDLFPNHTSLKGFSKGYTCTGPAVAYLCVIHVMNFIENDEFHIPDQVGTPVEHTSQDFRSHLEHMDISYATSGQPRLTIRQGASGLICTSPVRIPTFSAPYVVLKSRNFWFDSALIGDV